MSVPNARPGFTFCMCPDGRLVRREIDALLAAHPAPGGNSGLFAAPSSATEASAWTARSFWGDEELPAVFWEALTLQGLFATPQALILRNAHSLSAETWKNLDKALARAGNLTWPFLCLEGGWEKGQPKIPAHVKKLRCLAHAEAQGWIWKQPTLDLRGIRRYVTDAAKRMGLRLGPGAPEALSASLPADAATIENELEKLSLLTEDRLISAEQAAFVEHAPDFDIFAFLRQIQAGKSAEVWKTVLQEERRSDELIFPLLSLLQREARLLWQLRAGESPYLHPSSATAKREAATRLGFTGLSALWEALYTAELSIKSGARSPAQALDALLGDLTRLFK